MDFSVIIPSYNSQEYILDCLKSLDQQETSVSYEIIVVDSSPENMASLINRSFPEVKVVHQREQTYPGIARNIGVRESRGKILAFIDADCVAAEHWIEEVVAAHRDPVRVAVGSVVNGRPFSYLSQAEYFLEFREISPFSKPREMDLLVSANFSIRRELFQQLGGFSQHRASEDVIFARVIRKTGEKIFFCPEIKVFHMKRDTLKSFINNQLLLGSTSAIARRQQTELPGAFLARPYFIPLLPFVKIARTYGFIAKYSLKGFSKSFLILLLVFPVFFLGACAWAAGFARGLQKESSLFPGSP